MNRRHFLAGGAATLAGCRSRSTPAIEGNIVGPARDIGHLLRGGDIPSVSAEERVSIVIVGAGIAGLSAGRRLEQRGVSDFLIIDLEEKAGGNSRWDANAVSAYPWGAHYVPLPGKEAIWTRELFEQLGVITGQDAAGQPLYDERFLCAAPQERLYIHGRWQEGILPTTGARRGDLDAFQRFRDLVSAYRERRDAQGRKAFTIPMEQSSRDPDLVELDRTSFAEFLKDRGLDSAPLHWYADYACRDDFGCRHTDVSAWAGLHYFASRDGSDDDTVLTWPEGNGWIVARMEESLSRRIRTSSLAYRVEQDRRHARVEIYDPKARRATRIIADYVIFACPTFLARHVLGEMPGMEDRLQDLSHFEYAPWLVANLTLDELPQTRSGSPLAWDNVIYNSDSLGYVVATHQALTTHQPKTVLTYYRALANGSAAESRQQLLDMEWQACVDSILADLGKPHPEIREITRRIDVMKWGHAMIRPRPGFMWGPHRQNMARPLGRVHFANSDLSGFSIFEEAQFRGITAAEAVMAAGG